MIKSRDWYVVTYTCIVNICVYIYVHIYIYEDCLLAFYVDNEIYSFFFKANFNLLMIFL